MRRNTQKFRQFCRSLVVTVVPFTLFLYLLRGIGWLGFLNGGFLLLLIIISILSILLFLISLTY